MSLTHYKRPYDAEIARRNALGNVLEPGASNRDNTVNCLNSSGPSDTYMRQYNIPTLLQIMACRLVIVKPLSEPMLTFCQLDPKEQYSAKF